MAKVPKKPKTSKTTKSRRKSRSSATGPSKKVRARTPNAQNDCFPIVGLGASAGGLQALTDFFVAMPDDSGMAFVAIHHVDPDHESLMAELLAKHTKMSVVLAKDHTKVEPNHVYIIPPSYFLKIDGSILYLTEPEARRGMRLPIDYFLQSLAKDRKEAAIAIILSGMGSDGIAGIKSIKQHGGIVLVQNPKEAAHDGMPRSAVATGAVDHVLKINQMPKVILNFGSHPYINNGNIPMALGDNARGSLQDIVKVLKAHSPINFGLYKEGTVLRRIERRMALKHMENSKDYLALLKDTPEEAELLFSDLLISVTSFFRDPDAFKYIEKSIIKNLIENHTQDRPIRVWVPACASGEEVYSLAMLLIEKISSLKKNIALQIFASDVDEHALSIARAGVYPGSIEADVSPTRLKRFFIKEGLTYHVTTELREAVIVPSLSP